MFAPRFSSRFAMAAWPPVAILLAIVLGVPVSPASARTWYILPDGTGDAPTIQAGVDSAAVNDIVLVAAGTYANTSSILIDGVPTDVVVSISKDIRVISESGPENTTLGSPATDVVVYMKNVGTTGEISGFRIRSDFGGYFCLDSANRVAAPEDPIGIKCQSSSPRIRGNLLTENGTAIELNASPALIVENTISLALFGVICRDNSDAHVADNVIYTCGALVRIEGSAPQIVDNDLYDGCSAVRCEPGSFATISNNKIHDIDTVAIVCGACEVTIEDNLFFDNDHVVRLSGMIRAAVRRNIFFNQGSNALELSDNQSASITIESNTIDKTTFGYAIFCQAGSSPMIRANIIVRSYGGVSCVLNSNPTFECNDVYDIAASPYAGCSDPTGMNGNIAVEPQFCGVGDSGNYYLQEDSPCAPGNHPDGNACGQIGARSTACGTVPTKRVTWGSVKATYGEKRR